MAIATGGVAYVTAKGRVWERSKQLVRRNLPDGVLVVTPETNLIATMKEGRQGTINPTLEQYTMQNTGQAPIAWQMSSDQTWVYVSLDGVGTKQGTLSPGASQSEYVNINASATLLPVGVYQARVTFENKTGGAGTTSRLVTLTVNPLIPATLEVTPTGGTTLTIHRYSILVDLSWTLKNLGDSTLDGEMFSDQAWAKLFPSPVGSFSILSSPYPTTTTRSIRILTSDLLSLANGTYVANIRFVNNTTGIGNTTRMITVNLVD